MNYICFFMQKGIEYPNDQKIIKPQSRVELSTALSFANFVSSKTKNPRKSISKCPMMVEGSNSPP